MEVTTNERFEYSSIFKFPNWYSFSRYSKSVQVSFTIVRGSVATSTTSSAVIDRSKQTNVYGIPDSAHRNIFKE
ncbi:hypothetical protein KIN20_005845 [Parelaphostrongylus tenuis]|uniref:Uncharacterized protein n=1 Tax=Parelaphostrongylus tenuis TaxID=148309 RepID=A0AAD5QKJ0_PARTN|nr:hypothetical protein KIN20_005845 [Parelaphostrongylus tenuis]